MTGHIAIRPATTSLDAYPPLPRTSEADLRPVIRAEECACGEIIRQLAGDSITETVTRHNQTIEHRAWRYRDHE